MGPPSTPTLSVVVPAWNEADGLNATVTALGAALAALADEGVLADHELVLVDDGSSDATPELVDALARRDPHVRAVHHERNRGLGGALRTGIAAATGDLVLYTDADLPADPSCLGTGLALLSREGGLVCAYRTHRRDDGLRRLVYSVVYNGLVRVALGVRVRDVNFAFKLAPTAQIQALGLRSEGSFIDAELVARCQRAGMATTQFPVEYRPRRSGRSTLASGRVIAGILREMAALRSDIRRGAPCASP